MTAENRLILSYYKEISDINASHGVSLVKHIETGKIFVKKTMSVFNKNVYESLRKYSISGTPTIYEIIEDNDQLIIIEEYISGNSLEDIIEEGPLPDFLVVSYISQLCSILTIMHGYMPPIIHRDIKPSNIIITPDDRLILLDFNAARLDTEVKEEDTKLIGTKGFAAPEQYGFGSSDARTDIYATGMLMNTLLTGETSREKLATNDFLPIIKKCISIDPDNRYQTAEELKNAITSIQLDISQMLSNQISATAINDTTVGADNKQLHTKNKTVQEDKPGTKNIASYLPPGFRTKNPFHAIIACLVLFIIFLFGCTVEFKDFNLIQSTISRISTTIGFISVYLFLGNYLNCQAKFPFCKHKNVFIRNFAIFISAEIIFSIMVLINVFLTSIFS